MDHQWAWCHALKSPALKTHWYEGQWELICLFNFRSVSKSCSNQKCENRWKSNSFKYLFSGSMVSIQYLHVLLTNESSHLCRLQMCSYSICLADQSFYTTAVVLCCQALFGWLEASMLEHPYVPFLLSYVTCYILYCSSGYPRAFVQQFWKAGLVSSLMLHEEQVANTICS